MIVGNWTISCGGGGVDSWLLDKKSYSKRYAYDAVDRVYGKESRKDNRIMP